MNLKKKFENLPELEGKLQKLWEEGSSARLEIWNEYKKWFDDEMEKGRLDPEYVKNGPLTREHQNFHFRWKKKVLYDNSWSPHDKLIAEAYFDRSRNAEYSPGRSARVLPDDEYRIDLIKSLALNYQEQFSGNDDEFKSSLIYTRLHWEAEDYAGTEFDESKWYFRKRPNWGYTWLLKQSLVFDGSDQEVTIYIYFSEDTKKEILQKYIWPVIELQNDIVGDEIEDESYNAVTITQGKKEVQFLTQGHSSLLYGLEKVGKSALASLIATIVMLCNYSSFRSQLKPKVLFVDTEQQRSDIKILRAAIKQMTGLSSDELSQRLTYLSFRGKTVEQSLQSLDTISKMSDYGLVIIDNTADLVHDPISQTEAKKISQMVLNFTVRTNAHVMSVLHENKVNPHAQGAIGKELQKKAETVLHLTNKKGIVTVNPKLTRGEAFEPFSFAIAEGKVPVLEASAPGAEILKHLPDQHLNYSDLVEMICETTGKSESTAKRIIKRQTDAGLLTKVNGSSYQVNRI